jgi:hypothetical protein
MITQGQFPDLNGPTALPALGRKAPMKPNKGSHPLAGKSSSGHPLAQPPRPPRPAQPAKAAQPAGAEAAMKALRTPAMLGRFSAMDANTQLRKPK